MRAGWRLFPVLIIALVALVLGGAIGAFIADRDQGDRVVRVTAPSGDQIGAPVPVVTVEDGGRWHGFGFFPFGFLLFPLLWIGLIWLVFGGFWRRGGPGWRRWDERFEDWHRRQHEGDGQAQSSEANA